MNIIPGKQRNDNFIKAVAALMAIAVFALTKADKISAQYYENGDEEVSEIIVDKTLKGLTAGEWVDNYSADDLIFGPTDTFDYKIVVKNEGNRNQTWIKVVDTLPAYLNIVFGYNPENNETYDTVSKKLVYSIPEIKPGEEVSRVIRVQVKETDQVPADITRITNYVKATAESGAEDSDEAVCYLGNGSKTVETAPETGSKNIIIGSIIGIGIIAAAIILRKLGRGEFLKK